MDSQPLITVIAASMTLGVSVFASLMLLRREKLLENRSIGLAVFLICIAISALESILSAAGMLGVIAYFGAFSWSASILFGPSIYMYVYAMTKREEYRLSWSEIWRIGWPAIIVLSFAVPYFFFSYETKIAISAGVEEGIDERTLGFAGAVRMVYVLMLLGIGLGYMIAAFRLLLRHMKNVRHLFSNIEDKSLDWLRWILIILAGAWAWGFGKNTLAPNSMAMMKADQFSAFLEFAWVAAYGYFGLQQRGIYSGKEGTSAAGVSEPTPDQGDAKTQKYARSALDDDRMKRIAQKLEHAMADQQLFANPTLSLRDLSDQIGVSENYISQTLNHEMSKNFFDFVNCHRVERAKTLLAETSKTVLEIAHEVGFNSRSTFNAAFKKHADATPSGYRSAAKLAKSEG